ncbi:hypothetical protein EPA93_17860 [Ktedonosporobacter rubrisoli]|uniref:DUF721 domain-containing protein n=1 Tax=Ktedonosporobacter rubrisoli TaxID=2509675 RepID=A0A4P6JQP7_KTERU|nr:hypothetical protein [Ktedonosporobacter rubrisoli]QBD77757.1 hypothetical protein EPA93_17860 [Ktedonosporobacter rubrisoli]
MEQKKSHIRHDEFAKQFTSVLDEHWSGILRIINRQSPRVASLLQPAVPAGLKRTNGTWRIQVLARGGAQRGKFRQPRDNEIVAQSIRLYYHQTAGFKLPRVTVEFEF